jgi:putative flippase GtrA
MARLVLWGYEAAKFGAVGAIAYVVDNGLYALLVEGPGHLMGEYRVRASIIATIVATLVSYCGNRYWTFGAKRAKAPLREVLLFFAANGVGMLITGGCLYISHWILGFESLAADTISRNIGIALGTIFRYFAYKFWVFTAKQAEKP